MMTLDRRNFIKKIDLYFTDMAGNRLAGDYRPENGSGPILSDLEEEFDAGNLKFFFDADLASSYTKEDNTQAADGDTINQWKARFPADETAVFTRSSVDGLILTTFEDETHLKAITTNPSVTTAISRYGGHCGFFTTPQSGFDGYWAEQRAIEFIRQQSDKDTLLLTSPTNARYILPILIKPDR